MKKITLFLLVITLFSFDIQAQTDYYTVLSGSATSGNGRAPQGGRSVSRSVFIVTPTEMADAGFISGDVINALGFTYSVAQDIPTSGTMAVYMENTIDIVNNKSTSWATAITGMTTVSNGSITIPNTVGDFNHTFSGGSTFTYTGGGLYIAFDYQNLTNPLATTTNVALCNTAITGGLKGAISAAGAGAAAPTTLTASNFRPIIKLGKPVLCSRPTNLVSSNQTLNSATISWTNANTSFIVEYGAYGFSLGSGTTVNVSNATTTTLSSLLPSSVYSFYVRSNCGANLSAWNGPYSFNTVFEPTNTPYNSSFEQEIFPFIGWVANPVTTANSWFINYGGPGSTLVQDGLSSAVAITPAAASASEELYSRGINLNAGELTTITYYDMNYVSGSTNAASYTLTAGSTQTDIGQTISLNTTTGLNTTTFTQRTFTFTPSTAGVYYFRFKNTSPANAAGTHALIIDNFSVTQALSNNDFLASNLSVYPNPTKNIINISNSLNAVVDSVVLTDLNGRVVKSQKINATEGQVNISELATGIYLMNVTTDQGTATKKIIKE